MEIKTLSEAEISALKSRNGSGRNPSAFKSDFVEKAKELLMTAREKKKVFFCDVAEAMDNYEGKPHTKLQTPNKKTAVLFRQLLKNIGVKGWNSGKVSIKNGVASVIAFD
jgi:hypothetical protein